MSLVDLLARIIPADADPKDFVFHSKAARGPLSYWNVRKRGFVKALEKAGLAGRGITIHDLRSAAASLYAAKGLTSIEVAQVLGHADANVTLRVYARLFDKTDVAARIRAAQASLEL